MKAANLGSTSALILLMEEGLAHKSDLAQRYLKMLDLEPGREIYDEFVRHMPDYDQAIKNRKSCMLDLALGAVDGGIRQAVILGAGFDALSLEVYSRRSDCVTFEVDIKNMEEKSRLLEEACPGITDSIRCVTADLSGGGTLQPLLAGNGWRPEEPSVIIMEGISYYLPAKVLWGHISRFATPGNTNRAIMEYIIPQESMPEDVRALLARMYGLIVEYTDIEEFVRYDIRDVTARAESLDGTILSHHDMNTMERARTSRNDRFAPGTGWIEIAEFAV